MLAGRHRALPVPLWWVTLALSLLAHLLALFIAWKDIFPQDAPASGGLGQSLRVQLPQPAAAPVPATLVVPPEPPSEPPPDSAPRPLPPASRKVAPAPPPPVLAQSAPAPASANPAAPMAGATPANEPDLAQMIEARRRARAGAAAPAQVASAAVPLSPAEQDKARRDAIVAANMGTIRAPTMGDTQPRSGGVFSLRRVGVYDGEFVFYGWNRDVNRQMSQVIEVGLGNHPNMQIAIVRRMIALIRDHEKEDFTWQSARQGRIVHLSARVADTAALEDYLLREFFDPVRAAR